MLLILAGVVVLTEQRTTRRREVDTSARTSRVVTYRLGRWKLPAFGFAAIVILLGVVAPVAALIDWASGNGRPLTIDSGDVIAASINTVWVSVVTAVVAVGAVVPIAVLVGRHRDRVGRYAHAAVIATFAVPGILIALALRFWTLRAGGLVNALADTHALLIFAYVVRFASLAMGIVLVAVRTVPDRLHDAAATLGALRMRHCAPSTCPSWRPDSQLLQGSCCCRP